MSAPALAATDRSQNSGRTVVVLSVRDNGIGIAANVLPRVFDLFVQEQQSLDRSRGGLGIGLTIVENLVERHGGSIAARSEGLGKGSEFILRLPLALHSSPRPPSTPRRPERNAAAIEGSQPGGALASARRVLSVDDNEDGAEMLAAALSSRGYTTRVAHDAAAALRIAARVPTRGCIPRHRAARDGRLWPSGRSPAHARGGLPPSPRQAGRRRYRRERAGRSRRERR